MQSSGIQIAISLLSTFQAISSFHSLIHEFDDESALRLNDKLQTVFLGALGLTAGYNLLTRVKISPTTVKNLKLDLGLTKKLQQVTANTNIVVRHAPEESQKTFLQAGEIIYSFIVFGVNNTIFIVPNNVHNLDENTQLGMLLHEYFHLHHDDASTGKQFITKYLPSILTTLGKGLLTYHGIRVLRDYVDDIQPEDRSRLFGLISMILYAYCIAEVFFIMYMKRYEEYKANKQIPEPYKTALATFMTKYKPKTSINKSGLMGLLKTLLYKIKDLLREYPSAEQQVKSLLTKVVKTQ
jgi:hypothetical protein